MRKDMRTHLLWHAARAKPPRMEKEVFEALYHVLNCVIHHNLTHETDQADLWTAIDLLKAIRDEPKTLPALLEEEGLAQAEGREPE